MTQKVKEVPATSSGKPTKCFVIMPISTLEHLLEKYGGDKKHFVHVYEHLIKPALESQGIEPISPVSEGAEIIHGEIIRNIETADLVLCDISSLNPNVFFELGIRTAVNRSAILIKDDVTGRIPFDTSVINTHPYIADLRPWVLKEEIAKLSTHIKQSVDKSDGKNALWRYFSLSLRGETVKPESGQQASIEMLTLQVEALRRELNGPRINPLAPGLFGPNITKQLEALNETKSGIPPIPPSAARFNADD